MTVAIQRLERELGVVIVLRRRRFEGFTDEGRRVVAWAHRILAERDELLADIDRMRGRLSATARIGAIPTSVPTTPLLTEQFLRNNQAASIRIEALSSREIALRLADFELDAGLTYLDDETPPGVQRIELYRERFILLAPSRHPLMVQDEIRWAQAATLPLCSFTPAMRNRRIIDGLMAADGARFRPVVEADNVGAIFAHLDQMELATIASHAWLAAFPIPDGFASRPMTQMGPGPTVGLIVLDRKPNAIVVQELINAATAIDFESVLQSLLKARPAVRH